MQLCRIRDILDAVVLCGADRLNCEVRSACGSDFMSDVLAYVKDQAVLLTGLVNPQVVRTADMMEMKCIVFVRGKSPGEAIVTMAEARGIVVMSSNKRMYDACGLLYTNGLRGSEHGNH
ncbi:MAG: hypothetical protein HFE97_11560 [Oscillospiraceae bacterium]|nr:hypothetical protein [Oscillospiraceae bacterium]